MNTLVGEMYERFMDSVPDYEGKICIPISGGLDSRVLAGLITRKRPIDLAFCQYHLHYPIKQGTQIANVGYARKIAELCKVKRFEPICVNYEIEEDVKAVEGLPCENDLKQSRMYTGVRILNDRVDLKDYTMILGHGPDSFTGIGVNPFTLFNYHRNDEKTIIKKTKYYGGIFDGTYGIFAKDWSCPLWTEALTDWCVSLPMRYRFHQYLYRQMIKKYFPELAKVPREDMHVPMTIGEIRYFVERTKHWIRKQI